MKYKIEIEVEPQIIKYQRGNWTWIIDFKGSNIDYKEVSLRNIQELLLDKRLPITKIYNRVSQEFYFYWQEKNYIYREGDVYVEGSDDVLPEKDIPLAFFEVLNKFGVKMNKKSE